MQKQKRCEILEANMFDNKERRIETFSEENNILFKKSKQKEAFFPEPKQKTK